MFCGVIGGARCDTDSEPYFRFVTQCIAERGDDAERLISSGIDPEGWTPLPEDTAAMVDLASLGV